MQKNQNLKKTIRSNFDEVNRLIISECSTKISSVKSDEEGFALRALANLKADKGGSKFESSTSSDRIESYDRGLVLIPYKNSFITLSNLLKKINLILKRGGCHNKDIAILLKNREVLLNEQRSLNDKMSQLSTLLTSYQDLQSFSNLKAEVSEGYIFYYQMFKDSRGRSYSKCASHPITNKISRPYVVPLCEEKILKNTESSQYYSTLSSLKF